MFVLRAAHSQWAMIWPGPSLPALEGPLPPHSPLSFSCPKLFTNLSFGKGPAGRHLHLGMNFCPCFSIFLGRGGVHFINHVSLRMKGRCGPWEKHFSENAQSQKRLSGGTCGNTWTALAALLQGTPSSWPSALQAAVAPVAAPASPGRLPREIPSHT